MGGLFGPFVRSESGRALADSNIILLLYRHAQVLLLLILLTRRSVYVSKPFRFFVSSGEIVGIILIPPRRTLNTVIIILLSSIDPLHCFSVLSYVSFTFFSLALIIIIAVLILRLPLFVAEWPNSDNSAVLSRTK